MNNNEIISGFLIDQLNAITNDDLSNEEFDKKIKQAKQVCEISKSHIELLRVENEAQRIEVEKKKVYLEACKFLDKQGVDVSSSAVKFLETNENA